MNNNRSKLIKFFLYVLIIFCLLLPRLQLTYGLVKTEPLKGAFIPAKDERLTWPRWFSGQYQTTREKYVNEAFGFRTTLVRLNNQIDFSLFRKSNTASVVVGKHNYLYEDKYIEEYYGRDCQGPDTTLSVMRKLQFVQQELEKRGKNLLVVFAAGKASYYPEYIPDNLRSVKRTSNYDLLTAYAQQLGIHHIDFNKLFVSLKPAARFPLFPKYGIHWSKHTGAMVTDSIVRMAEKLLHTRLDRLTVVEKRLRPAEDDDMDIGKGLNLLFDFSDTQLDVKTEWKTVPGPKPKAVAIGDSFFWIPWGYGLKVPFERLQFWYYYHRVYDSRGPEMNVEDLNLARELEENDFFVIIATEANLRNFGFGFVEQAYDYYRGHSLPDPASAQKTSDR